MLHVSKLKAPDQLICYMRNGLGLRLGYNTRTNESFRYVPRSPERARNDSLTVFRASVISNDISRRIIRLNVTAVTAKGTALNTGNETVEIPWNAFLRMRLISPGAFPGHPPLNPARPTSMDPLGYWNAWPYHTAQEVNLYGDS